MNKSATFFLTCFLLLCMYGAVLAECHAAVAVDMASVLV